MEKYQSKTKLDIMDSLLDEKDIYIGYETQKDNTEDVSEEDNFDTNTESIEILEFELEKRYMTAKSNQESTENRHLDEHENNNNTIKRIIAEFEEEYK